MERRAKVPPSQASQLPYLKRPVLAPIPSKLIAAQNATVRRARNTSTPLLFLDTSAAGVPDVLIARNQPDRGRKCEIAKNLDFLLEMAKGRYAGGGGKQILRDVLLLP